MRAPGASVRENPTVPARGQHPGRRHQTDAKGSSAVMNTVCPATSNPCTIHGQLLVACLSSSDRFISPLNGSTVLCMAAHPPPQHTCLGTKLSTALPSAFQGSPGERGTTEEGTHPFPLCPCPCFASVRLFFGAAGWGTALSQGHPCHPSRR